MSFPTLVRPRWLVAVLVAALGLSLQAQSNTLTTLHLFYDPKPTAALVQARDGFFYGVTEYGGDFGHGTIFKLGADGSLVTLHSFNGADGDSPVAALLPAADGSFYGTTAAGGTDNNGTIFRLAPDGTLTTLHSFSALTSVTDLGTLYGPPRLVNADGSRPVAALIQAADGFLYGTTADGGAGGSGTIFKLTPDGTLTTLHGFSAFGNNFGFGPFNTNPDGGNPLAALIQGRDGSFYGTASRGGMGKGEGVGTLFKITADGTFTLLFTFSSAQGNTPATSLVQLPDGSFFGTTAANSSIYRFTANAPEPVFIPFVSPDGVAKPSALVLAGDGDLYGTTTFGGANQSGTIFQYRRGAAMPKTLHSFTVAEGSAPLAAPVLAADGSLYGTTSVHGTAFRIATDGTETTIASFTGNEGADPEAAVVQAADGSFYGTTARGGPGNVGTVYHVAADGTFTTLHAFNGPDGATPLGSLIQGTDGFFYGTTSAGGPAGDGTVFRLAADGTFATLHAFTGDDGAAPKAGLFLAGDGFFYGTTSAGGLLPPPPPPAPGFPPPAYGTVFRMAADGTLTTLHDFDRTDGTDLRSSLIQGTDGSFYGTTYGNGPASFDLGTVFKLAADGTLTTLHGFHLVDGYSPTAAVIQASDGNFYGTTQGGPTSYSLGTIFKLTADGTLSTFYDFGAISETEGVPVAAPVQARDGDLYGTTRSGNADALGGTLYRVNLAGALVASLIFNGDDGSNPAAPLIQARDGQFYGTTSGAARGAGTVFRLDGLAVPVITSAVTASGQIGAPFSYQIIATGSPTVYLADGLPTGLSVDRTSGLISGTPTGAAGTFPVALSAVNSISTGTATLTLTLTAPPTVSLMVRGDGKAEFGVENGSVLFERSGDTGAALTVAYKVKGTAQAGVDFKPLSGTLTIPAGAAQARLKVKPRADAADPGKRKVKIMLLPSRDGSYVVGSPALVKIIVVGDR